MTTVEIHDIGSGETSHKTAYDLGRVLFNQEVEVIGHETVGVDLDFGCGVVFGILVGFD